jgi:phosphoglycerate-specific signal transduction histidine kinase
MEEHNTARKDKIVLIRFIRKSSSYEPLVFYIALVEVLAQALVLVQVQA